MTSDDGDTIRSPPAMALGSSLDISKTRTQDAPSTSNSTSSLGSLPFRRPSTSILSRFASTSTPPRSRATSPSGAASPSRGRFEGIFSSSVRSGTSPLPYYQGTTDDPRSVIFRAIVPYVAVHASADTEAIAAQKGFGGGLREMLRPFGEQIQGKVTIRDSIGASRSWEDFGVRFVGLGDGMGDPTTSSGEEKTNGLTGGSKPVKPGNPNAVRRGGNIIEIDELVEKHLSYAEMISGDGGVDGRTNGDDDTESLAHSPFHRLHVQRLLSGMPLSPHETFSHPVACIIAISSNNSTPIESLRQLYEESSRGEKRIPLWVNGDYLRYYVLVHDEERGDIARSVALFDAMKRNFGLHCHLLRLRSSRCVPSDDDSIRVPKCEWISAAEELEEIDRQDDDDDIEEHSAYLVESDVTAIKTFVRTMVTQSVVPFMERCVVTWNDQVASRRRGISGRFMSLSKKWTGFGSSSRSNSSSAGGAGSTGSGSNYDALQGFYRPDTPEATMRKLADYAFMLRDWKLAQETYDILRSDFSHDKAWKYHAGANEMAAISTLLWGQKMTAKVRAETIDLMLETASYSYITRCAAPYYALRCLALGVELLRFRGGAAADDAAKWGTRLLELKVLGTPGSALFTERVAACYAMRQGVGSGAWGARRRKSSLWHALAADAWLKQDKLSQAEKCLEAASRAADKVTSRDDDDSPTTIGVQAYIEDLAQDVRERIAATRGTAPDLISADDDASTVIEEESEKLDTRAHRKSLIGQGAAPFAGLDTGPLSPVRTRREEKSLIDDNFQ